MLFVIKNLLHPLKKFQNEISFSQMNAPVAKNCKIFQTDNFK